jgi:hypothetical protein
MGAAYFGLIGILAGGMMVSDHLGGADPSQLVAAGLVTLAGLAAGRARAVFAPSSQSTSDQ